MRAAKRAGTYTITCAPTGQQYVGATADLHTRRLAHFSTLRAGRHLNRNLQALFDEHGDSAFVWQEAVVESGPGLSRRLRAAEFHSQQQAGERLVGSPSQPYGETGDNLRATMAAFRSHCLVCGLIPQDEMKALVAEFIRSHPT